ncbi:MAG: bifunctional 5,10-methylene-tetrahydrofolate dehydrogenase/5,10-methylene-tetrahydrofolate cyclohydrolase [Methanomassiliicoccales archaeon]|nr:bifunctional 5,10-methylene-tetrahydrofolate dehydrogenase/5,10-methylene-tetrahydrofolate cyclohydrolase [Methanomassiliicoccales archaeon]
MPAQVIDCGRIAAQVKAELKDRVLKLHMSGNAPGLAVVLVGDDPASKVYVNMKAKECRELGINSKQQNLPATITEDELLRNLDYLQADPKVHGLLVQMPLPDHISETKVMERIDPDKDVDGFNPINVGRMLMGAPGMLPCTPHGIQQLLVRSGNTPEGKHVVIVGRSNIVGKPMAAILVQKAAGANATVTVCHSATKDLASLTRQADVLIAAMGRPQFIKADMVNEGAVVVDVGMNRVEDAKSEKGYRLVGDADFEAVSRKAKAITPVPGGVGLMTRAMLMVNTVRAAEVAVEKAQARRR